MFKIPQILFMFAAVAFCAPYENQDTKLKDIDNKYEKNLEPFIKNFANSFSRSNVGEKMAEENLNLFYMQSLYAGALSMRAMQAERSSDIPTTTATNDDETTFLPYERETATEKAHKPAKDEESATQINIFVSPHIDVQNSQTSNVIPKNQNDEQISDQYEYHKSRKAELEATFGAMFNNDVNKESIFSSRSEDENAVTNLGYAMTDESQKEIQTNQAATVPHSLLKQSQHTTENGFIFGSMKIKVENPLTSQEQLENKSFSSTHPYEEESRIVSTNEPAKQSMYVTDKLESNIRKTIPDESIPHEQPNAKSPISDHLHVQKAAYDADRAETNVKKTIAANKDTASDTTLPQTSTGPKNSDTSTMPLVIKTIDAHIPILAPASEQKFSNAQENTNNQETKDIAPGLLTTETPSAESAKDVLTIFVPEDSPSINSAISKTMGVTQNENNFEATASAAVNVLSTTKGKVLDETTLIPKGKNGFSGAETSSNAKIFEPKGLDAHDQSETKKGFPARVSANGEALKVFNIDTDTTIAKPTVESLEKQIETSTAENFNEAVGSTRPTSNWFENGLSPKTIEYLTTIPDMDTFERSETRTLNVIKNPSNHLRTTTKSVQHKKEAAKDANIPQTTTDTTDVTATTEKTLDLREATTVVDGNMNDTTTPYDDKNSNITTTSTSLNNDSPTESSTTDISNIKETTIDGVTAESDATEKPANIAEIIQAMAKYLMTNGTVDLLNNSESRNMYISKQRNDDEVTTPISIIDTTTKLEMTEDTTLLPEQQTEVFITDKSELGNSNSEIEMVSATTMDAIISSSVKPYYSYPTTTVETTKQASNLDIILLPPSLLTETHTPIKTTTTDSVAYATTMRGVAVPKTIMGSTLPRKPTTEPDELELQIMKPTPRVESTLPFTTENSRSAETTITGETTTYEIPITETESYGTSTNVPATEMNPLGLSTVPDSTSMFTMLTDDDQTKQSRISETTYSDHHIASQHEMESTSLANKIPETASTEISEALDITKVGQQVDNNNNAASMKKDLTEPEITIQTIPLRRKPPVKISRILSDEGVEVYYGYSNVERN